MAFTLKRTRLVPAVIGLCTVLGLAAAQAQPEDFGRLRAAAEQKCGQCHDVGGAGFVSFESTVTGYSWPLMPLRVWLDSQHRPRIPTVDMSEADALAIAAYIDRLVAESQQVPLLQAGETVDPDDPKFDKPMEGADPDRVVGEGVVQSKDCLNCGGTHVGGPLN